MTKEEKSKYIEDLTAELAGKSVFYLTDTGGLDVETVNQLRSKCFRSNIEMRVVKNSLFKKALQRIENRDYTEIYSMLKGPTSVLFAEVGNVPAKLILDFRKKFEKPLLKGAYVDEAVFVGEASLKMLSEIKSKEELVGEIIGLLQSPAKNVVSGLKSGGGKLAGIVKTLASRTEA
jgi:large subunit ribosomal protein L10